MSKAIINGYELEDDGQGNLIVREKSTGEEITFDGSSITNLKSLSTEDVNNELYASNQSGNDLSAKVENALGELKGGRGAVVITPPDDGQTWSWESDVVIDPTNYAGLELVFRNGAEVDYTGSGVALTIDAGGNQTPINSGDTITVRGGTFTSSGSPNAWFLIRDTIEVELRPRLIYGLSNSSTSATGIVVENVESFCENPTLEPIAMKDVDRGIDFRPASVTGGSGTDSFASTRIVSPTITSRDFGMRLRGQFTMCEVANPTLFADADNYQGFILDGNFRGTIIHSHKIEDVGDKYTGTVGFDTDFSSHQPIMFGGLLSQLDSKASVTGTEPPFTLRSHGNEFQVYDYEGETTRFRVAPYSGLVTVEDDGAIRYPSQTPNSEASNRSTGTWYQNTTGQALAVYVTLQNDGGGIQARMAVDPNQNVTEVDQYYNDNAPTNHRATLTAVVPDGDYYKVFDDAGTATIKSWKESTIGNS